MSGFTCALERKKPQPLKHNLRYARAVTVCIAVVCQEDGNPRIVLCSDSRLDYAELGSTNTTCKLDVLGHGWCVQMAGHWSGIQEWTRILKGRIQKAPGPIASHKMAEYCQWSIGQFAKSSLYQNDQDYQLLISGFDSGNPVILKAGIYLQGTKVETAYELSAIGEGEIIGSAMLRQRQCHAGMPLSYVAYLAYEAKRASEKCGSVGHVTALAVQAPLDADDKERAGIAILNDKAAFLMESVYKHFWSVPCARVQELTPDFFIDPTKKQVPE